MSALMRAAWKVREMHIVRVGQWRFAPGSSQLSGAACCERCRHEARDPFCENAPNRVSFDKSVLLQGHGLSHYIGHNSRMKDALKRASEGPSDCEAFPCLLLASDSLAAVLSRLH